MKPNEDGNEIGIEKIQSKLNENVCKSIGKKENRFYVYNLIDPVNNIVFYIGKGCKYRYYEHIRKVKKNEIPNNNLHLFNKIKKIINLGHDVKVLFIKKNITEKEAFELEINEIKKAKKNNIKLCNLTNGGEGASGYIPTEEYKLKMKKLFSGTGNPFYGKHHTQETIAKIKSNTPILNGKKSHWYGKHHTEKSKQKISISHIGLLSKDKHHQWKFVTRKDEMEIIQNYKQYGLMNTIKKLKYKNYGYDVIKRILIDNNIFRKYKYYRSKENHHKYRPITDYEKTSIITLRNTGASIRTIVKKLQLCNIKISFEKVRQIVNSISK